MSAAFAQTALRCVLGLGSLERRGSRGRPWLTLIRPGAEFHSLVRMKRQLSAEALGPVEHTFDWIPGGGEDVCRLRLHIPDLEPLVDLPPPQRWRLCGPQAAACLWLDRGLWLATGRGGLIRIRRTDAPEAAREQLEALGVTGLRWADSGKGPYRVLAVGEASMRQLVDLARPYCSESLRFALKRWRCRRRHGLMALGRCLGAAPASEWEAKLGFLP
jgi:hypothetical protein